MELLVVTEKHGMRFFVPDSRGTFLQPFMELIYERLEGDWYEDVFKDQARELLECYSILGSEEPHEIEELLQSAQRFLEKRRVYEYEDWEIVTTEN